jgi:hypothetical protein
VAGNVCFVDGEIPETALEGFSATQKGLRCRRATALLQDMANIA